MPRLQAKSFDSPDESREMERARLKTVTLDDATVGLCRFTPGWRWSVDAGPVFGVVSCPLRHAGYVLSGRVHVVMDDGQTLEVGPNAVYEIPPGHDKWVVGDEPWVTVEWGASGRAFAAALRDGGTRALATVMFTDIVGSTRRADEAGDAAWQAILARHNADLRRALNVYRGREVKTTGDGFLAVFDSPTRAVRCALEMLASASSIGLELRVGIHTGEIETIDGDVRGLAVHTAARVLGVAGPGEILVSASTAETLDADGLTIEDAGSHLLKGLAGPRRLSRVLVPRGG